MQTRRRLGSALAVFAGLVLLLGLAGAVWGAYVNNGDGTVTDTATGLMWQQADDGQARTWQNALSYCEALDLAGQTDWRLPDIRELQSIVDDGRYYPAINSTFNCQSTFYWSGSTHPDPDWPDWAWYVDFHYGYAYPAKPKSDSHYVRCVRGGPALAWNGKKIKSNNPIQDAGFGGNVAISGDYLMISNPVSIFERNGGNWDKKAEFSGTGSFGHSIAISKDYAIVGNPTDDEKGDFSGSVYIYKKEFNTFNFMQKITANDGAAFTMFGGSVAVSGNHIIVGTELDSSSGSAYIFEMIDNTWTQTAKIKASDAASYDFFGVSVAIDGDYAVVGAHGNDDNGDFSGSAYVFRKTGGDWDQIAKLLPYDAGPNSRIGFSVGISGQYAIIGSFGAAYIFQNNSGNWTQVAKLNASESDAEDWFGRTVAISGNFAIIGASLDDSNGIDSGAAYIFHDNGFGWNQLAKLLPNSGMADDYFGESVAISDGYAVVGARGDDEYMPNSGAAYLYDIPTLASYDSDGDGMPDSWETTYGFDLYDPDDALLDADNDGLSNLEEYQLRTNPHNPDTDGDGMPDSWEVASELDPKNSADALFDSDEDNLDNLSEYIHHTDPRNGDTDGDGISDGDEVQLSSDPLSAGSISTDLAQKTVTVSLTGNNRVFVKIENQFCTSKAVTFSVNGIDPSWFTIAAEDQAFTLAPFEKRIVTVQLQLPPNCSLTAEEVPFEVESSWQVNGDTRTGIDSGLLSITSKPNVFPLAIPKNTKLAANRIALAWKTDVACNSSVYFRKLGENNFTVVQVALQSYEHRISLENLDYFTQYEFYTQSISACNEMTVSQLYTVRTGKAIRFVDDANEFWIDRDNNQPVTLSITNTDIIEHTFSLSVISDNSDIQVGFVGDGTAQRQATLIAGQSREVELVINAGDALKTEYDIYLQMVSDEGQFDSFHETVHAKIHVRPFVANLAIQPVDSQPGMMTSRFRLMNYGDSLSDIEVFVDPQSRNRVVLNPAIHHIRLDRGGFIEFDVSAQIYTSGTVYARSGAHTVSAPFEIGCAPGTNLSSFTVNNVAIVAAIRDWYCTNKMYLNLPFRVPLGFSQKNLSEAALEVRFELPMALEKYDPHDVTLSINGTPIAFLENIIPQGTYLFRLPTSLIHLGLDAPADNHLTVEVKGITPGHYIVVTDFKIILNIDEMRVDLCTAPPLRWFLPKQALPDPHTRIVFMAPAKKIRPGQIVTVSTVLSNDDSTNNPPHQGLLTINLTNNSAGGSVPPKSETFAVTIAGGQRQTVSFDYTIPENADDIDYTFSATFQNSTLSETTSYSKPGFWVRTPLIVVHGIMGSRLHEKMTDKDVWSGNMVAFSPCDNFMEALKCPDKDEDEAPPANCDIQATAVMREQVRLKFFGTNEIIFGDVFNGLEDYLKGQRYKLYSAGAQPDQRFDKDHIALQATDPEDVFYFVYDWRIDNAVTAQQLKTFLDNIATAQNYPKLNILAHSMGGLVCKSMLQQDPQTRDRISKLILLGTPNLGAVETFSMFKHGLRAPRFGSVIPLKDIEFNEETLSILNSLKSLLDIITDPSALNLISGLTEAIENSLEANDPEFCNSALEVVNFIFDGLDLLTGDPASIIGRIYDYYNLDKDLDGIRDLWMKKIILELPSAYQLLPSAAYHNYFPVYYVLDGAPIGNATTPSIDAKLLDIPNASEPLLNKAKSLHGAIDDGVDLPDDTYSICGCKNSTARLIDESSSQLTLGFFAGDGDGTVPIASARHIDAKTTYAAQYAQHLNLPSHEGVRKLIRSLLKGEENDFPTSFSHPVAKFSEGFCGLPSGARIKISPSSGSAAFIGKNAGNESGAAGAKVDRLPKIRRVDVPGKQGLTSYTGNTIHTGILGSDYRITTDGVEIFVPEGTVYELVFKGVDSAYLDIKYELMTAGGVNKTFVFYDIPISSSGTGIITGNLVDPAANPILKLDNDGDELFEQQNILPSYVLDENASNDTAAPTTTSTIAGTLGANEWYVSGVTLTLNSTDAGESGILGTRYRFDSDANFTDYTGPIPITTPGVYTVYYYTVDRNLNQETNKTVSIRIDDGMPPQIVSFLPEDQSSDANPGSTIQIVLSKALDTMLINPETLSVYGSIHGDYTGQYSFDPLTNRLSFIADQGYLLGEHIMVNLSGNLKDPAGNGLDGNNNGIAEGSPLDDFFWSFFITEMDGLNVQIAQIDTSNCSLVKATVMVTDEAGSVVANLGETNFSVYDNYLLRNDITVEFGDQSASPASISLALDYSGSMSDVAINNMEAAAVEFVNTMGAQDEGQIVKFANGVQIAQGFTTNKAELNAAISAMTSLPRSATHLYDAIYQAITDTSARSGRKAVIVMTDGADYGSVRTSAEVISHSATHSLPVFTIGLGSSINAPVLQMIANDTGGLYYEAPTSDDLIAIYQAISEVLNNQYMVTFSPTTYNGQTHTLYIVVKDGALAGSDTLDFVSCNTCTSNFDTDSDVDGVDLVHFLTAYSQMNIEADLNADGAINDQDVAIFTGKFGQTDCNPN
jgi:VWFA-related protein